MNELASAGERVVSDFGRFAEALQEETPIWLPPLRKAAIERFAALGFPSRKREDWKYTNIAPIARTLAAAPPDTEPADRAAIEAAAEVPRLESSLVFVNGRLAPELSSSPELPEGAVVDGLARVSRERPELVEPHLARSGVEGRSLVELNTAFQRDGAFVRLPRGVTLEHPIHLVFVSTGAVSHPVNHLRNLVVLGESAAAVVVEHHVAVGDPEYLCNTVSEVEVGSDADLDHVVLESASSKATHLATCLFTVHRDARLRSYTISTGAALARNEIHAVLAGPGAECDLNGLYLADGDRHVDNQTVIDHAVPNGTSRELFKGVLDDRSHGIFNGKVIVRPGAQKTSALQSNPNLLLSNSAEVDTRPNLEIHADDVKCSHGATVGRLDDEAMFFLRARGIGEEPARRMLCRAFAEEVIAALPLESLREDVKRRIAAAFGGDDETRGAA